MAGERARLLPDVVVEWATDLPQLDKARHPAFGTITGRPGTGRTGNHRFAGFVASSGSATLPGISHVSELGRLVRVALEVNDSVAA